MLTCWWWVQRHLAIEPQVYITHFVEAFPDIKARPTLTAAVRTDWCHECAMRIDASLHVLMKLHIMPNHV